MSRGRVHLSMKGQIDAATPTAPIAGGRQDQEIAADVSPCLCAPALRLRSAPSAIRLPLLSSAVSGPPPQAIPIESANYVDRLPHKSAKRSATGPSAAKARADGQWVLWECRAVAGMRHPAASWPVYVAEFDVSMRLALFQPDIPQNTGALLRLGACLGVAVDLIEPCGFMLDDRRLKRAALDYRRHARMTPCLVGQLPRRSASPVRLVLMTTHGRYPLHRVPVCAGRYDPARPRKRRSA